MAQHLPDNAEQNFKCSRCGHMFSTEGHDKVNCPHCGFGCSTESCQVVDTSNEDY